jgi:hypothetical protein
MRPLGANELLNMARILKIASEQIIGAGIAQ